MKKAMLLIFSGLLLTTCGYSQRTVKGKSEKKFYNISSESVGLKPQIKEIQPTNIEKKEVLKSDVDENFPLNNGIKKNIYVLAIGNEDYSSFQVGLSREANVDYALNDAKVFCEYAKKTLGVPEKNVYLLENATYGQMMQYLTKLETIAEIKDGEAELIFYYSGHGLPHENTKEAYLIPVDVSGVQIESAVKLDYVVEKLTKNPSKKVTMFIDACFSGGARNESLIAMKSVKVKPKENLLKGNLVVFTSSTGEESSGVYKEKYHGMFTYFLLKKLQESGGKVSYGELAEYIEENVELESVVTNDKRQTPQVLISNEIEENWREWKLLD